MSILPRSSSLVPRVLGRLLLLSAASCAAGAASDLTPLREEVAALRQAHDADRKRIEALEIQTGLQQSEILKLRGLAPGEDRAAQLPVIHLQPRAAKALPALSTETPVREPPPEMVAELKRTPEIDEGGASGGGVDADGMFNSAFEKLKTGELVAAAGLFQTFSQKYPRHPAADNALLDEGIAYYGLHRYEEALAVFEQLAKRYPAGDAVPEGLWRSADCYRKLGQAAKAQAAYTSLIKRYPASPEAAKASEQLAATESKSSDVAATEGASP